MRSRPTFSAANSRYNLMCDADGEEEKTCSGYHSVRYVFGGGSICGDIYHRLGMANGIVMTKQ